MLRLQGERLADIVLTSREANGEREGMGDTSLPSLCLDAVSFRYSELDPWVLRETRLTIPAGAAVAIVGPSGCGKTTLAKVASGLERPSAGRVVFGGRDITALPAHARVKRFANFPKELDPDEGEIEIISTPESADQYISAEVMLPKGGTMTKGCVAKRIRDDSGNPVGRAHDNPILDTREYTVEFDDGDVSELTANLIAESMYAQCDPDGNQYVLLDSLTDYRRLDTALKLSDQTVVRNDNRTYKKRNTIGWQICCQWKDGSTSWERLSDLKELHPVLVAERAGELVGSVTVTPPGTPLSKDARADEAAGTSLSVHVWRSAVERL